MCLVVVYDVPVLLHGGLDEVGGRHLPDEVHQSVGGRHVAGVQRLVPLQTHALHVTLETRVTRVTSLLQR